MNHFEGRLDHQEPNIGARYFASDDEAEDFIAEHPGEFCCVVRNGHFVSVYYGRECK